MALTERLAIVIDARTGGAVREFQKVSREVDKLGGQATKTAGAFDKAGAAFGVSGVALRAGVATAAVAAGGALLRFANDAAKSASDLEQSVGGVEAIFGSAAGKIFAFGDTAAKTAGLSRREVNEMAAVIGAQLQGMGFTAEEAADKVLILEQRAADMAATFGGPTSQALTAITALFRGERDPIEKYGVTLKQTDINARIAAKGLDTSTTAALKQSTAIVSLDLVLDGTAKTVGRFKDEMNSLAGQEKQAAANAENVRASLGKLAAAFKAGFLTEVNDSLGTLDARLSKITKSSDGLARVVGTLGSTAADALTGPPVLAVLGFGDAWEKSGRALKAVASAAGETGDATDEAGEAAAAAATALDKLRNAAVSAGNAKRALASSLRAVEDAERNVADRQRELNEFMRAGAVDVEKVASATLKLRDAEESLAEMRERLVAAQQELNRATQQQPFDEADRALDLADAKDRVADAEARLQALLTGGVNERDKERAVLRLLAAEQQLAELREDTEATQLQLREAELELADAQDAVAEAEQAGFGTAEELTDARRTLERATLDLKRLEFDHATQTGVVTEARQGLAAAEREVKRAEEGVAEAQAALREAQAGDPEFAEKLAEKRRDVARASESLSDAQWAAAQNAIQLRDAERELDQALKDGAGSAGELKDELFQLIQLYPSLAPMLNSLLALRQPAPGSTAGGGFFIGGVPASQAAALQDIVFGRPKGPSVGGLENLFPPRASGGPVGPGAYLVGERGPELLLMGSQSGHVVPNSALGGGVNITVNAGLGADGDEIARKIADTLNDYRRRGGLGPWSN